MTARIYTGMPLRDRRMRL